MLSLQLRLRYHKKQQALYAVFDLRKNVSEEAIM